MLKLASFFAEFKLRLIIGGLIVAAIGLAYWSWSSRGEEIKKLESNAAVATVSIGSLEGTVKDQAGSAAIKETINTAIAVDAEKITIKHDKIVTKTKTKVASIEKAFEDLPKTPENIVERDTQTSAAMIDGLWDTYCAGVPNVTSCATPT